MSKWQDKRKSKLTQIKTSTGCRFNGRAFLLLLAAVTAFSMLLRGIACWQMRDCPAVVSPMPATDMATYWQLSRAILTGHWPQFYDYQPFYYVVLLPCSFFLSPFGDVPTVMIMQSVLGGAAVYLAGVCGTKLGGRRAGLFSALLLCVCRFHIFYTPFMLLEVLQSFWMALIAWLAMKAHERNRWRDWVLLGLCCGCSTLTRGNALLFMPGFALMLVLKNWRQSGMPKANARLRCLAMLFVFVVVFYLPQLPFSLRNYHYFGDWRGPSMAQNKVLALGNTPEAPPGGLEYPPVYHSWVEQADDAPPDQKVGILHNILRWVMREPWAWPELKFRSLLLFWSAIEIPNNVVFDIHARDSWLLNSPLLLDFAIIGALGMAGCIWLLCRRKSMDGYILLYMVLTYWLGTSGFYMLARFRIGALPLLCIAGGIFINALVSAGRSVFVCHNASLLRRRVLSILLLLVVSIFIVNVSYPLYQQVVEKNLMSWLRPDGLVVELPKQTLVYDHGPLIFGGCEYFTVNNLITIEKTLIVPKNLNGRKPEFWLWAWCDDADPQSIERMFTVIADGALLEKPRLQDNYIIWQLPKPVQDKVTVKIVAGASNENTMVFNIDTLRYYGRTEIDGELVNGELVAELRFDNQCRDQ